MPGGVKENHNEAYIVYDGECPMCRTGVRNFALRDSSHALQRINGRTETNHPVILEIRDRRLDIDRGMILKYRGKLYHGADALHVMSSIAARTNWVWRVNATLFRSKPMAQLCYPLLRLIRNTLIRIKGVPRFSELEQLHHHPANYRHPENA
jgi:predicted DCC family thiol-disulfide oxidoreductase YuxK